MRWFKREKTCEMFAWEAFQETLKLRAEFESLQLENHRLKLKFNDLYFSIRGKFPEEF